MGIYSTKFLLEEDLSSVQDPDNPGVDLNQIEEDIVGNDGNEAHSEEIDDAVEGVIGDPLEECYQIMYESEYNYNTLLESIGIRELKEASAGREYIMEAVDISGFFKRVKDIFISMFKKITQFFKKVFNNIKAYFMDDKKFITKYKKDIEAGAEILKKNGKLKDKEGYTFPHDLRGILPLKDNRVLLSDAKKDIKSKNYNVHEYTADALKNQMNIVLGFCKDHTNDKSTPSDIADLAKKLTEYLYGKKAKVFSNEILTAKGVIDVLSKKSELEAIEKAYSSVKDKYQKAIDSLKEIERDAKNSDNKSHVTTICNFYIQVMRFDCNVNNTYFTVLSKAVKAKRNQARKLANTFRAAAGNSDSDSTPKKESAGIFENIDFI